MIYYLCNQISHSLKTAEKMTKINFQSKMKFLNLKALGLLALLFLVFTACDKILPPSGNGVDIPVKIRAVAIAGGAQNETITRADGASRMVGEPVIQDLGGGVFAEITVEEDLSALRNVTTLGSVNPVKFRVIAVNSSDNKVYSYADYTTGSNSITRDASTPDLHVLSGGSYYFVCISHNNMTLPNPPDVGDDLSTKTVAITAGSNDLLYQTFTPAGVISATGLDLSFTNMRHQFVKAQLKLDAGSGKTITAVPGSISMDAPTSGTFDLKDGKFSSSSGTTLFTGWTDLNTQTVTSGEFTFLPKATDYTLSWPAEAVTVTEGATQRKTVAGNTIILNSKLLAGRSYTIALKFYRLPRFAGSNIYWDGSQLTFDPHGTNTNTKYQGVFFKWGSLIGVSPAQTIISGRARDYFSSGTVANSGQNDGTPIYLKVNDVWVKTNVAYATTQGWFGNGAVSNTIDEDAWSPIPYYTAESTYGNTEKTLLDNSTTANFNAHKGDICYYIDKDYRMPTGLELDSLVTASSYSFDHGGFTRDYYDVPGTSDNDKAGKYAFTTNYGTLTGYVLPASGRRDNGDGLLDDVGSNGGCWSGSARSSTTAYCLYFGSSVAYAYEDGSLYRDEGFSVRCVLQE
jgi:hypothetical protein